MRPLARLALAAMLAALVSFSPAAETGPSECQTYHAHATVLLLAIPILTVPDAGVAEACYAEQARGSERRYSIRFAARSRPERTRGLRRLGYWQETVIEKDSSPLEAEYFGFMTASPEKNFREAETSFRQRERTRNHLKAVFGALGPQRRFVIPAEFAVDEPWFGADWQLLANAARAACQSSSPKETAPAPPEATTLLFAIARAIRAPSGRFAQTIGYSNELYRLETSQEEDRNTAAQLVARGLLRTADDLRRLRCRIENVRTRNVTRFIVWADVSAPLPIPVRLELRPRGFLRLVFEAEPDEAPAPAVTDRH